MIKVICVIFFISLSSLLAGQQHYYLLTHRIDPAGLFSTFHTVLGALDFMETNTSCCGLGIDFEDKGLYYDHEYGTNWWEYFFEAVDIGTKTNIIKKFPRYKKVVFSLSSEFGMSRERGHELIKKYVILKSHIKQKIDNFCETHFKDVYIIGVHYRGTDKCFEAEIVPYKNVHENIISLIKKRDVAFKIFIATDDSDFLAYMHAKFPGRIVAIDAIRTGEGTAVHFAEQNQIYKKGEDAVMDCVLLSKCDILLKMSSNLSNCSIKFNPYIPVIELNKSNGE